ncbi:MAG: 3-oxoacyl-ACP synthase III [Lacipirellulaceae bacterium]
MRFRRVCIEAVAHVLPDEVVSSDEVERRLEPLYRRLRLPEGRLELMSGIRERRFFPPGTLPGDVSIRTADLAIQRSGLPRDVFGACLHGSVCRDCLEPATACRVHHALRLPTACIAHDVSNACLGVLSGVDLVASLIEVGRIKAGVVVGTETGRTLVENTIAQLNADQSLTRETLKDSIASLTIGSASAAVVLCDESLSSTGRRLVASSALARTEHHTLCRSEGLVEVMRTDSERLLEAGVAAGAENYTRLLSEAAWSPSDVRRTVCHQVGSAHRKRMLGALGVDPAIDYATFDRLGNTGAAALPASLSMAAEEGFVGAGDRVALLGIGSGVNCLMMAVEWA